MLLASRTSALFQLLTNNYDDAYVWLVDASDTSDQMQSGDIKFEVVNPLVSKWYLVVALSTPVVTRPV